MNMRIAAYAYLFIAGIATEILAFAILGEPVFSGQYRQTNWGGTTLFYLLPGFAAMAAARLVQQSYLRSVRARQRKFLYDWIVIGVIAAHLAYGIMALLYYGFMHVITGSPASPSPLDAGWGIVFFFGVWSLILGFLPNLLFAIGLTEAALWRQKKSAEASAAAD